MSTALAIASVSLVLKDLLNNGLIDHDISETAGNVLVTCLPPDRIVTGTEEPSQLNLFLYHVSQNPGWRNQGYPSLNSSGERVNNPPLALDLHYLLTAYSSEELISEILLGYGMQLFHENPVLKRDAIRRSLSLPSVFASSALPANLLTLSTSKLAEQVELVKITPATMNTEEMSKLWTAFQAKYRPTAAYTATVVLIESEKSTKTALPVKDRNIYVVPFRQPVIEKIKSQALPGDPVMDNQKILDQYRLVITGYNLKADNLLVNIDGTEYTPATADVGDTQVIFQLPAGLQAGIHGVQVTSQLSMGTPEALHSGFQSNVEAFVLCPTIDPTPENIQVTNVTGTGGSPRSADIGISLKPALEVDQRILFLMNQTDNAPGTTPLAYSFNSIIPASPPAASEDIVIHISGVEKGTYLMRIQVDGAESPLLSDAVTGKYNKPLVTIP